MPTADAGIERYGAYLPVTRLPHAVISEGNVKKDAPEKAVAWIDEDSVTMAVAAASNCLKNLDRSTIDSLIFASTTPAFAEKQSASIAAKALNLRNDVRTLDICGSLRSGLQALQQAIDSVIAGSATKVLVLIADTRMAAPKSNLEKWLGDGAAAFLIGSETLCAKLTGSVSLANEMMDTWRRHGDAFVHHWEERFINLHGFHHNSQAAVAALLSKTTTQAGDYDTFCCYAPDPRAHLQLAKALGFKPEQIQDPLFNRFGNTGSAFAPLQLVAALEQCRGGEKILLCGYGDGADAIAFQTINATATTRGVAYYLKRRRTIDRYETYLNAKGFTLDEYPQPDDPGISATVQFRNRDENLSLEGQVCQQCGTHQFPKGRVCIRCRSKDNWAPVCYANQKARVLTYTLDSFFPSPEPPTAAVIVEVIGTDGQPGPRIHMQLIETDPKDIVIGMEVEFSFRVIHRSGRRPNYFWKCLPQQDNAAEQLPERVQS